MSALPEDVRRHREWIVSLVDAPAAGLVVDLGCGRGDDLRLLAARHASAALRMVGVDGSADAVRAARAATTDARVAFACAGLDGRLPFASASVDVVYSHNLLECLADPTAFAAEVARVLRPGGQAVVAHWDWDTQLYDAADKALVRRLVHAYADWQQGWMAHADGWMGRRLWGAFRAAGGFAGAVHARVLTNTAFAPPWFGHANAEAFGALARRGLVDPADVARFAREQAALDREGRYFYSITGYAYAGRRVDGAPRPSG